MNRFHSHRPDRFQALLIGLLLSGQAYADSHTPIHTDTIDSRPLGEVVVTGSRQPTDVRHLSQTVTVISRSQIEESMQPSLLPLLTEQVPGLFTTSRGIMGYGVSNGAAGGISLRGLNGSSARMMVLIDGHPQYAGIFGHPISDSYQSLLADRVEVLRGPASMLYGSNAMGGVVNIVTRRMHSEGVRTTLRAGYGSYNTLETEFTNMVRHGRLSTVISGSYNRTDGHRSDMGFEQYGGYAKASYTLNNHWDIFADVNITHFNASYPGPVTAPLVDGDQRITRGVTSASLSNDYGVTSGAASFFYNWGNHWINDGYTPSAGQTSQDGRFNSRDNMTGVSVYQSASLLTGSRITLGFDWFRYGGKAWTDYVAGEKIGTRAELVDKHEDEFAAYIDARQRIARFIMANAGVRVDRHSRVGTEWVPRAGLSFSLHRAIELKLSASKGFRYPTLREMYMFPPQNPDLQPESMWNYEIALTQSLLGGRLTYGVNIFHIDGKNLIQTLPNPSGSGMLNQNTGKIDNSGIEFQGAWRISRSWSVDANYSFLHMERPIIAAPEHKLHAGTTFTRRRWSVSTGIQYIAGLYTAVDPDTRESFVLWNLRSSYRPVPPIEIWARGENLLAQRYEINAGYPMPRATVTAGINLRF
ncbi:MAG: TonB-dependent receptor [Paramuribaculum sp.]|nr:TonB-dependent receptor [Paramuribaculum sp.]